MMVCLGVIGSCLQSPEDLNGPDTSLHTAQLAKGT